MGLDLRYSSMSRPSMSVHTISSQLSPTLPGPRLIRTDLILDREVDVLAVL
jgi:hypothetical protein